MYIWVTLKLKEDNKNKQLSHLFLKDQGTIFDDLKAK